jgi:diacylglycerol kinase family enzyme
VASDREAAEIVAGARRSQTALPPIGLVGGDLYRTLGAPGDAGRVRGPGAMTFAVDLGVVLADGRLHFFVAHLVARSRAWTRTFAVMNAQWLGNLNLGPRAHPNDGLLDVYDARLPLTDLLKVRARARAGAHLPHPGIKARRAAAVQVGFDRPLTLWLDGARVGPVRNLSVRVEPDALTVVV